MLRRNMIKGIFAALIAVPLGTVKAKESEEFVTLDYLKSLPMFGSMEWFEMAGNEKAGTRALFRLDAYSKEKILEVYTELGGALLVETLPRVDGHDTFRLKGVNLR